MTITSISTPLPDTEDLAALISQVWESFLGETLLLQPTSVHPLDNQIAADKRAVASVSINGPWTGHLTIALSEEAAGLVAAALFELEPAEVTVTEIADAIGELANVVGGNVKAMLPEPSSLSLPQVVVDAHAVTLYAAKRQSTATVAWNEHLIDVVLWHSVGRRAFGSAAQDR